MAVQVKRVNFFEWASPDRFGRPSHQRPWDGRPCVSQLHACLDLFEHGLELGPEPVLRTYAIAMGSFAPHLTIILDLPVDEGLERARQRGGDNRYERMDRAFHQRLRDGFLEIARREPERCAVIDARPDPDAVHREIVAVVEKRLGLEANG